MLRLLLGFIFFAICACGDSSSESVDSPDDLTPEELENLDSLDPAKNALEIYIGITNPIGVEDGMEPIACEVYLMAKNTSSTKLYFRTSFGHEDESHPYIIVEFLPDELRLLGVGSNNSDTMILTFSRPNDYQSLTSINLRWKHDSHFHTSNCYLLKLQ